MDNKARGQILDTVLLKRLMTYTRPYRGVFVFVMFAAILLSVFSTLTPYLLKITVDDYISLKDYDGLVLMISLMLGALLKQCWIFCSRTWFVSYRSRIPQRINKN